MCREVRRTGVVKEEGAVLTARRRHSLNRLVCGVEERMEAVAACASRWGWRGGRSVGGERRPGGSRCDGVPPSAWGVCRGRTGRENGVPRGRRTQHARRVRSMADGAELGRTLRTGVSALPSGRCKGADEGRENGVPRGRRTQHARRVRSMADGAELGRTLRTRVSALPSRGCKGADGFISGGLLFCGRGRRGNRRARFPKAGRWGSSGTRCPGARTGGG